MYDREFGDKSYEKIGVNDQGMRKETLTKIMEALDRSTKSKNVSKYGRKTLFGQPFIWLGYLSRDVSDNENIGASAKESIMHTLEHFANTGEYIFSDGEVKKFPNHEWYSKSSRLQYKLGKIFYNSIKATNPDNVNSDEKKAMDADIYFMKSQLA